MLECLVAEEYSHQLLAKEENTLTTHHPQILKAKFREENEAQIERIKTLIASFKTQDNENIVKQMKAIVPEFISNNSTFEKLD